MKVTLPEKITLKKGGIKVFAVEFVSDIDNKVRAYIDGDFNSVCYNCDVSDFRGNCYEKYVEIIKDKPQNFWFSVSADGEEVGEKQLSVKIVDEKGNVLACSNLIAEVLDQVETDPFEDIYSLNRLTWLNSNLAINKEVTKPYIPVTVDGKTANILGRKVQMGNLGFPSSIKSYFSKSLKISSVAKEVLSSAISFNVDNENFKESSSLVSYDAEKAVFTTISESENFILEVVSIVEFDGFSDFKVSLKAKNDLSVNDINLVIPINEDCQKYFVGLNKKGGKFDKNVCWKWNVKTSQDCFWIGDVNAGVKFKFKGDNYVKPLVNIYYNHKPINLPESWGNDGKGGIDFIDGAFKIYSGTRKMASGETLLFNFEMIVTPLREIDLKKQFGMRFFHTMFDSDTWLSRAEKGGANIINVHHGNDLNPYINYPFFENGKDGELTKFITACHDKDIKVKLYYTIRELTINLPEFKIFRDLGYELIEKRNISAESHLWQGEAKEWIKKNVGDDVIPAWRQPLKGIKYKDNYDSSVITDGQSRLCNFYVEGLNYLVQKSDIDGIYIDDVAYDRNTMKRVRRVLDQKDQAYIDFHQWNHFVEPGGKNNCANMYMELYPYVDKVWIGEGFEYDESPDFWLVEMSGIPFGLMGEMMNEGNQWRGLTFGMTNRLGWESNPGSPVNIWKIIDEYNLGESELVGWWDDACKVKTDNENVLASTYLGDKGEFIALANFSNEEQTFSVNIDGAKDFTLYAPEVERFQKEQTIENGKIKVNGGEGLFLVIKKQ